VKELQEVFCSDKFKSKFEFKFGKEKQKQGRATLPDFTIHYPSSTGPAGPLTHHFPFYKSLVTVSIGESTFGGFGRILLYEFSVFQENMCFKKTKHLCSVSFKLCYSLQSYVLAVLKKRGN